MRVLQFLASLVAVGLTYGSECPDEETFYHDGSTYGSESPDEETFYHDDPTTDDEVFQELMGTAKDKLFFTKFPLSPLFPLLMVSLAKQRQSPKTASTFREEYDYIVVGGGAAGSVVASRLSEVACVSVLLLEAGKPPPILTDLPYASGAFIVSHLDWKYRTVPQRYTAASLVNKQVHLGCGKTLGGGSTTNTMISNRGNKRNFNEWAEMGATGWSYDDVLPYFRKLEDNRDPDVVANGYHGVGGPVTVSRPKYTPEVKGAIKEAVTQLGYSFVDVDGPKQHGISDLQLTMRDGQRCSTAKAYLVPSENRTNLDILTKAMVTRILFENRKAVGVEFDFKIGRHKVKARREVILSAGGIGTPKLLMLSGIGPMNELNRLKIPLVADLPVGLNLQDHIGGFIAYELSNSIVPIHKRIFDEKNVREYINSRSGPLEMSAGISLLAFLSNNATGEANDIIDHELYFVELTSLLTKIRVGINLHAYLKVFSKYEGKPLLICMSQVLHPKSRGTVRLRSRNPYTAPDIDPHYLEDPQDMEDIVEGLKKCIKILASPPMSKVGAKLFDTSYPGCEKLKDDLDEFLKCTTYHAIISVNHPVGTAKMGNPKDPSTVVDPQLRVKTVENLRVVDASVMPTITWGNTNIPTIMIGEKASDMIKSTIECAKKP